MVDSPSWHLIKALNTLVSDDGNTITIEGYPVTPPISADEKAMIAAAAKVRSEDKLKQQLQVSHWIDDLSWQRSEEHTSELQSLMRISYAVFCLKKKKQNNKKHNTERP